MSDTFYWHDYETFGVNPARDRPVQFAGLRTDADLNIVGDPLVIYCRPANDFLPHPQACLVTGITPQQALAEGVPECEFIARIHQELAEPGTCGVGYNSLRFDDEVTRYTLYRNFYVGMYGDPLVFQSPLPPFLSPIIPSFGTGADHLSSTFSMGNSNRQL